MCKRVSKLARYLTIKKNEEFQTIFDQGHSRYGRYLVVYFLQNGRDNVRFGFCVGKKIGKAVARNRIRRLFRVAVDYLEISNLIGWDILLVARRSILKANLIEIVTDLNTIKQKSGIFTL
jgi:ribonuclease P protein component